MKIIIKTLEGKQLDVDVSGSDSVAQLRTKISAVASVPENQQKLIFKGKILQEDNKTVDELGIKENDFMVMMVIKIVAPKPAAATAPAPASTPTPAPAPAAVTAPVTAAAPPPPAAAAPATPGLDESIVSQLCEMGFPRDQVTRALRAAYGNPDRAVEYLTTSIPDVPEPAARPPRAAPAAATGAAPAAPTAGTAAPSGAPHGAPAGAIQVTPDELMRIATILAQGPSAVSQLTAAHCQLLHQLVMLAASAGAQQMRAAQSAAGGQSGGAPNPLASLRQLPMFQQMRQMIRQNPQMLQPLLQQLAQTSPELVQVIQSNPDAFLQLLEDDSDGAGGAGGQTLAVTTEERDAIERLCKLGFPRNLVVQVFFACDKNEELAANYLYEHGREFDGEDGDDGDDDDGMQQ